MTYASIGSDIVNYVVSTITSNLATELGSSDAFLARNLYTTMNSIGGISLGSQWFLGSFSRVMEASTLIALIAILVSSVAVVLTAGASNLTRTIFVAIPAVGIGSSVIVPLFVLVLRGADVLSRDFYLSFAVPKQASTGFDSIFTIAISKAVPPLIPAIVDIVYLILALILELEFVLRAAAIYLIVALMPFAMALYLAPRTRAILVRLIELCFGLVLSKVIISLGLGISLGLVNSQSDALGSALASTAILFLCITSPFVLVRLMSGFDSGLIPSAEMFATRTMSNALRTSGAFLAQTRAYQLGESLWNNDLSSRVKEFSSEHRPPPSDQRDSR